MPWEGLRLRSRRLGLRDSGVITAWHLGVRGSEIHD